MVLSFLGDWAEKKQGFCNGLPTANRDSSRDQAGQGHRRVLRVKPWSSPNAVIFLA